MGWFCLNRNFSDWGKDGQCQQMGQSSPLLHFAHKMWPNLCPVGLALPFWPLSQLFLWPSNLLPGLWDLSPFTEPMIWHHVCHPHSPKGLQNSEWQWWWWCLVAQLYPIILQAHGLPGSSVYGNSQARILQWVAISSSREFPQPRNQTHISCIGRWVLYHWATWKITWEEWCITFVKNKNSKPHV